MAAFIQHEPCPDCGSRDNLARYADGSAYCFGCGHHEKGDGSEPKGVTKRMAQGLLSGAVVDLTARRITADTCAKFGYRVGTDNGQPVQIADYRNDAGEVIAQKVRTPDKSFYTLGDFKNVALFGQHLWSGGKKIVITEGEIDCLTVSQAQGNKWPVVSIPKGANLGSAKELAKHLEFLSAFEEVILMFDMDEPGREAAKACAAILPVGKAYIASLPMKDPSELMQAGRHAEIVSAIWNAKPYRPDGLLTFDDVIERIEKPVEMGIPWWDERLTAATYGRRYREVYTFGAGTGIGKTDWLTQQIAYDMEHGLQVGLIFLETPVDELGKRIAGKHIGKTLHVPESGWLPEELKAGAEWLRGKGILYDSFGQTDWDVIAGHIRYMATALGIKVIYLDHLTALADTEDERGSLEKIMKELAGLAHECGLMVHLVSHLTTPEKGASHEEGGRVTIRHFKGSRAIGFWSNFMFGLERNQQSDNADERHLTVFRVLKDRNTGRATGNTYGITYDAERGLLVPCDLGATPAPANAEAYGF